MRNYESQIRHSKKYQTVISESYSLKSSHRHRIKCLICKESRATEMCHIVPVNKNGDSSPYNIMVLCPTHHYLFDQGKLNDREFDKVRDKFHMALKYNSLQSYAA